MCADWCMKMMADCLECIITDISAKLMVENCNPGELDLVDAYPVAEEFRILHPLLHAIILHI